MLHHYKVVEDKMYLAFSSLFIQTNVGFDVAIYDTSLYDREPLKK